MDFTKELKKLRLRGLPVSVYTEPADPEYFSFGYVAAVGDTFVYLCSIAPGGIEDGMLVKRLSDIFRIEYDGVYEQRLVRLYEMKAQHHKDYLKGVQPLELLPFLRAMMKQRMVVSFVVGAERILGVLHSVEREKICVTELDDDGRPLGEVIIRVSSISEVSCDAQEERDIALLMEAGEPAQ